jgi:hypothetical protein
MRERRACIYVSIKSCKKRSTGFIRGLVIRKDQYDSSEKQFIKVVLESMPCRVMYIRQVCIMPSPLCKKIRPTLQTFEIQSWQSVALPQRTSSKITESSCQADPRCVIALVCTRDFVILHPSLHTREQNMRLPEPSFVNIHFLLPLTQLLIFASNFSVTGFIGSRR